ncbi:MAG TPA: electron transfer flavoprotein subunit beta/FixA family protein [Actinomycetota bacterium]|nr:electron transfer flavoprotein subunit beta/FixA family protein [Actinomycetota bacterium]
MNICVCVKQIPDPNNPYELSNGRLKRDVAQNVLDPGDEFGVEAALQLVEAQGGEVTVVSMGPDKAMDAIRRALSMGAHKGVLVTDDALAGADALVTARVLAAAIKHAGFDLVIAGVESTDGYTGTVPGTVAELLGVPQATFAKHLEVKDGTLHVQRQTEKGYDDVECPLPAVVTVTAGVNEPRYPTFKGIMQAKSKPVETLKLSDLGLSADDAKATQTIAEVTPAPPRGAGEKFEDDGSGAAKVADFLKEAKVI